MDLLLLRRLLLAAGVFLALCGLLGAYTFSILFLTSTVGNRLEYVRFLFPLPRSFFLLGTSIIGFFTGILVFPLFYSNTIFSEIKGLWRDAFLDTFLASWVCLFAWLSVFMFLSLFL
jgi:hypothetical protein